MAARRSPTSSAPGAAARMARRISAGSSERGLSSVTMARSAPSAAALPIRGRLARSRSPPAPNTTIRRPETWGRKRGQHGLEAVGRMGVVHIGVAAVRARAHVLQPPRRALQLFEGAQHRLDLLTGGDAEARRRQHVGGLEGAGQRQAHVVAPALAGDGQALAEGLGGATGYQAQAHAALAHGHAPSGRASPRPRRRRRRRVSRRSAPPSRRWAAGCGTGAAWRRDRRPCCL